MHDIYIEALQERVTNMGGRGSWKKAQDVYYFLIFLVALTIKAGSKFAKRSCFKD